MGLTPAAALAGVAAALAVAALALLLPAPRRPRRGARGRRGARRPLLRGLVAAGGVLRPGMPPPRDLEARILAAGRPAGLGVRELMAAKLASLVLGATVGLGLASVAPGRLGLLLGAAAPVAGFLAPDLWLRRHAGERARLVRRELPALVDLLRVTIDAGLPLPVALGLVGERTSGPLGREWGAVGRQVALGVPLTTALEHMSERMPQEEVRILVKALERGARHGAPLGETLAAQARDARESRRRRIQEDAARASPKIQLVVALLLVPSVLLMVAAALATALLGGSNGVGLS